MKRFAALRAVSAWWAVSRTWTLAALVMNQVSRWLQASKSAANASAFKIATSSGVSWPKPCAMPATASSTPPMRKGRRAPASTAAKYRNMAGNGPILDESAAIALRQVQDANSRNMIAIARKPPSIFLRASDADGHGTSIAFWRLSRPIAAFKFRLSQDPVFSMHRHHSQFLICE